MRHRAGDGSQLYLARSTDVEGFALDGAILPTDGAFPARREDGVEEGYARQRAGALHPEFGTLDRETDDVTAHVEVRWHVVLQPRRYDGMELLRGEEGGVGCADYRILP